jgi:hypothetical protein
MKPRSLQSPNSFPGSAGLSGSGLPRKSPYRNIPIDPVDDSENLNPEDIQQSLRTTANAIQVSDVRTDRLCVEKYCVFVDKRGYCRLCTFWSKASWLTDIWTTCDRKTSSFSRVN